MAEALEITTFKLVAGHTVAEFVIANADIDAWLQHQPGFQWRRISEMEDGSVVDVLLWTSAEQGRDAAGRIIGETRQSRVHAMIDHRTVGWRIAEVRQHTARA